VSSRFKLFIPLIIFTVIAAVFFRLESRIVSGEYDPSLLPSALIGHPVPEFSLASLSTNRQLTSSDLPKQAYIINVWASWCISCRVEHSYLNALSQKGIKIIGLNYKDRPVDALQWLERLGNPYLFNLSDINGQLGLDLGVYGAPENYIVGADGIIRYRHVGILDDKVWRDKIAPLGLLW
tara:strand:- start:1530 stop:2069 length:540 start_codon:yes stop_codon:yes gene_type:complete